MTSATTTSDLVNVSGQAFERGWDLDLQLQRSATPATQHVSWQHPVSQVRIRAAFDRKTGNLVAATLWRAPLDSSRTVTDLDTMLKWFSMYVTRDYHLLDDADSETEAAYGELPAGTVGFVEEAPELALLHEAADIITGHRANAYGPAEDSFRLIADFWTSYLDSRADADMITADDVANMMILMKVARQANQPKRDNLVDIAGYAALAQRCIEKGQGR